MITLIATTVIPADVITAIRWAENSGLVLPAAAATFLGGKTATRRRIFTSKIEDTSLTGFERLVYWYGENDVQVQLS